MIVRDHSFTVAIDGENVSPETVSLRDLYEVLSSFENALAIVAKSQDRRADNKEFTISLTDISPGSDVLTIATSTPMFRAAGVVSRSIAQDDFSSIPTPAHGPLRTLWRKAKSENWNFRIESDGNGIASATILADREILRPGAISGQTTLYGRVDRVGGFEKGTLQLLLFDGNRVTIRLATRELTEELGEHLFEVVGLLGEATWDLETWRLTDFRADELTEYRHVKVTEAFERLASVAGNHWDDVDPEEYVSELRAD